MPAAATSCGWSRSPTGCWAASTLVRPWCSGRPSSWPSWPRSAPAAPAAGGVHRPGRARLVGRATATLLGTSEVSVKSALQRARAIMKERLPQRRDDWGAAAALGDREREVLRRYIDAHQHDDVEALAEALADDVRVAYPQIPLWSDSRDAFIEATREHAPPGDHRFVATGANRQPAVAIYTGHRGAGVPAGGAEVLGSRRPGHRDRRLRRPPAVCRVRSRPDPWGTAGRFLSPRADVTTATAAGGGPDARRTHDDRRDDRLRPGRDPGPGGGPAGAGSAAAGRLAGDRRCRGNDPLRVDGGRVLPDPARRVRAGRAADQGHGAHRAPSAPTATP